MALVGLFGRPFVDLEHVVDAAALDDVDDEITQALPRVDVTHTGGTLKWMGVVAPFQVDDGYVDAMHAIEAMPRDELARFVALGDAPESVDLDGERRFGDETDHPFTRAQVAFLKMRHAVYFPWKVCYHLLENDRWDDKHDGAGKAFGAEAIAFFPRTVALVQSLPFEQIGRCVIFGLEANDHAPFHRDTEPGALSIAQSISLDPRGSKRFALADADGGSRVIVDARAYWFNDMDYHGVLADPFFRYSIRVDGTFTRAFERELRARLR
jgi:Rieske 2Fe-2S family protein